MSRRTVLSIPNILTMLRIVLIPVVVTALIYQRYRLALVLFIVAGLTDLFDGLLARLTNQGTPLGAFLDPVADKVLLLTSFIVFSVYGWIPTWLVVTVISRDLIVMLGWALMQLLGHPVRVAPTRVGKAAIASEIIVIAYILADINFPGMPDIPLPAFGIVAALAIVSGFQYVIRGLTTHEG